MSFDFGIFSFRSHASNFYRTLVGSFWPVVGSLAIDRYCFCHQSASLLLFFLENICQATLLINRQRKPGHGNHVVESKRKQRHRYPFQKYIRVPECLGYGASQISMAPVEKYSTSLQRLQLFVYF